MLDPQDTAAAAAASTAALQQQYQTALDRIQALETKCARLEQKHVEIHTAKELYLKVLEDFPALIWRSGLDKMCDYFNRTWLEWTGKTMEQEVGLGWTHGVHPDDFDECLSIYTTAFDARQAFCMEYRLLDKYGQYRWIRDHGRPFHDLDGTFLGYIGSCYDITETKTNEQRLATLNKTKDKLFGLVTKDLRHPVATVVSLADFLHDNHQQHMQEQNSHSSGTEELGEIATQIQRDAHRTLELVDNLLQWTRNQQQSPSSGGGELCTLASSFQPQAVFSQDLFRQVLSQVHLCAKTKKITIRADGGLLGGGDGGKRGQKDDDDDNHDQPNATDAQAAVEASESLERLLHADNVMMVADRDMIVTVLRNLVMNRYVFQEAFGNRLIWAWYDLFADFFFFFFFFFFYVIMTTISIKFTHPGGFITLTAQQLDHETVLLSVKDTGVGMSEDARLTLFDEAAGSGSSSFSSSSSLPPPPPTPQRGTGNELGSGMGLVLCRDFIERHQGQIWVADSSPDQGTCIQMTLPATMAHYQQQKEKQKQHTADSRKRIYYKLGVV
jgi:PAS domain S-box-containing protein